jgi:predicted SprT family Zn-dependent metalloprotease
MSWKGESKKHREAYYKGAKSRSITAKTIKNPEDYHRPYVNYRHPMNPVTPVDCNEWKGLPLIERHKLNKNRYYPVTKETLNNFIRGNKYLFQGLKKVTLTNPSATEDSMQRDAYAQYLRSRKQIKIYSLPIDEKVTSEYIINEVIPHELGHFDSHKNGKIWNRLSRKAKYRNEINREEEHAEEFKETIQSTFNPFLLNIQKSDRINLLIDSGYQDYESDFEEGNYKLSKLQHKRFGLCKQKAKEFINKNGGTLHRVSNNHFIAIKDNKIYDYVMGYNLNISIKDYSKKHKANIYL